MCQNGGNSQKLCNETDCEPCLDKSFASHEKSIYWSDANKAKPRDVFKAIHFAEYL